MLTFVPSISWAQAEFSRYYIEGDYAMHQAKDGRIYYTLSNIETRGITIGLGNSNKIVGIEGDVLISLFVGVRQNQSQEGVADCNFGHGEKKGKGRARRPSIYVAYNIFS